MFGAVLSILIVTDADATPPTPLVAVHVNVCPVVSAVSVVGLQPVLFAIPLNGSCTVHETLTSLRYHPPPPAAPVTFDVIDGTVPHSFPRRRTDPPRSVT